MLILPEIIKKNLWKSYEKTVFYMPPVYPKKSKQISMFYNGSLQDKQNRHSNKSYVIILACKFLA